MVCRKRRGRTRRYETPPVGSTTCSPTVWPHGSPRHLDDSVWCPVYHHHRRRRRPSTKHAVSVLVGSTKSACVEGMEDVYAASVSAMHGLPRDGEGSGDAHPLPPHRKPHACTGVLFSSSFVVVVRVWSLLSCGVVDVFPFPSLRAAVFLSFFCAVWMARRSLYVVHGRVRHQGPFSFSSSFFFGCGSDTTGGSHTRRGRPPPRWWGSIMESVLSPSGTLLFVSPSLSLGYTSCILSTAATGTVCDGWCGTHFTSGSVALV